MHLGPGPLSASHLFSQPHISDPFRRTRCVERMRLTLTVSKRQAQETLLPGDHAPTGSFQREESGGLIPQVPVLQMLACTLWASRALRVPLPVSGDRVCNIFQSGKRAITTLMQNVPHASLSVAGACGHRDAAGLFPLEITFCDAGWGYSSSLAAGPLTVSCRQLCWKRCSRGPSLPLPRSRWGLAVAAPRVACHCSM